MALLSARRKFSYSHRFAGTATTTQLRRMVLIQSPQFSTDHLSQCCAKAACQKEDENVTALKKRISRVKRKKMISSKFSGREKTLCECWRKGKRLPKRKRDATVCERKRLRKRKRDVSVCEKQRLPKRKRDASVSEKGKRDDGVCEEKARAYCVRNTF